jgi:isopenicillin N synthase-like dioxygenase
LAIIPVSLNLSLTDEARFARELGGSFERYGFAVLADHDLDPDLIAKAYAASRAFFALPDAVKARYNPPGGAGQRGYTPFGIETAKGHDHHDLKEFWHVGRELAAPTAQMPANLWPDEVEGFREAVYALFEALDAMGGRVLRAIARHLGLAEDFFEAPVRNGNSILRLLHYPPLPPEAGGSIRAGAHEDINVITLLLGAEEAGLQVKDKLSGEWIDISPPEGALVINIGDMLQRLTNGVLPSTSHRVINPQAARAGFSRYSMPFFLHFAPDYLITPLEGCVSAERPPLYEPITAQGYLEERLRELKLKA